MRVKGEMNSFHLWTRKEVSFPQREKFLTQAGSWRWLTENPSLPQLKVRRLAGRFSVENKFISL